MSVLGDFFPGAQWQRCMAHFYRNVFNVTPKSQVKEVAAMPKAIHGQEVSTCSQNQPPCEHIAGGSKPARVLFSSFIQTVVAVGLPREL
ncbi:MAG: transposase [Gemmatales bacterium]